MFVLDNIRLSTRNFKTRKLRTFLTVLGISVGIGTTLFLVSLGYGLQKVLLEKIAKSDALLTLDVATTNAEVIKINKQVIDDFSKIPNVTEVSPLQTILSQFKVGDATSNIKLSAVNSSFLRLGGIELFAGENYKNDQETKVILSTGALTSLGIDDPKQALGREVSIKLFIPQEAQDKKQELSADNEVIPLNQKFIISGIVDDSSESSGFIPSGWTTGLTPDAFNEVKVRINDSNNLEAVRQVMIEGGFSVLALTDTVDQANKIFSIIQIILALFGIVALTVSAIGMFNTMTIALLERTNEIGTMKAIGASNREVQFLFLTESLAIGFLGGVGGVAIGLGGAYLANFAFNFLAKNLGGQAVQVFYTPVWFVIFILTFSAAIGFITGIYPATRASRLNPLVALRYK